MNAPKENVRHILSARKPIPRLMTVTQSRNSSCEFHEETCRRIGGMMRGPTRNSTVTNAAPIPTGFRAFMKPSFRLLAFMRSTIRGMTIRS